MTTMDDSIKFLQKESDFIFVKELILDIKFHDNEVEQNDFAERSKILAGYRSEK